MAMVWLALIVLAVLFFQHREQLVELRSIVDRLQAELRDVRRQLLDAQAGARPFAAVAKSPPAPVPAPPPSIARIVPASPRPSTPLAPLYVPPKRVPLSQS